MVAPPSLVGNTPVEEHARLLFTKLGTCAGSMGGKSSAVVHRKDQDVSLRTKEGDLTGKK